MNWWCLSCRDAASISSNVFSALAKHIDAHNGLMGHGPMWTYFFNQLGLLRKRTDWIDCIICTYMYLSYLSWSPKQTRIDTVKKTGHFKPAAWQCLASPNSVPGVFGSQGSKRAPSYGQCPAHLDPGTEGQWFPWPHLDGSVTSPSGPVLINAANVQLNVRLINYRDQGDPWCMLHMLIPHIYIYINT
jgi:hypothetical protein